MSRLYYSFLNSLTQQVHQVSSVGAGSFPFIRDTIFSYSLVILYHALGANVNSLFDLFVLFSLFLCPLFGSTPHYIILFSNVKPPQGMWRPGKSPVSPYSARQDAPGECRIQEVGELGVLFVLFRWEFAYFAWGGGAVTD